MVEHGRIHPKSMGKVQFESDNASVPLQQKSQMFKKDFDVAQFGWTAANLIHLMILKFSKRVTQLTLLVGMTNNLTH